MQSDQLYQEIILDHYRKPRGRGLREPFDVQVRHVNPTCGDEIDLRVKVDGDTVVDVSYEGMGCSISQASTSVLYELVVGQPVLAALSQVNAVAEMIGSRGQIEPVEKVQIRQALCSGPGGGLARDIRINWVWLPPWGPDKITDEGRDQVRSLGFNV